MNGRKRVLGVVFVLVISGMGSGCAFFTPTILTITPEPNSISVDFSKKCGTVLVKKPDQNKMTEFDRKILYGFVNELDNSGICDEVYYHSLPEGPVDLTLDVNFTAKPLMFWDSEHFSGEEVRQWQKKTLPKIMARAATLGMVAAPMEEDYYLTAEVAVYKDNDQEGVVDRQVHAHWKSKESATTAMKDADKEVIMNALYKQLIKGVSEYCESR